MFHWNNLQHFSTRSDRKQSASRRRHFRNPQVQARRRELSPLDYDNH